MTPEPTAPDSVTSAKEAGLRYVTDEMPGIRRIAHGKDGFTYKYSSGKAVHDAETLSRIKSLVIPPAWKEVWICPIPNGHLQATGRDDRNRKQHRYHARYRQVRDEAKFEKVPAFAKALPHIHRTTSRQLKLPGLPREKVMAAVVQLLEKTLIRVGNEEYAKQNGHFGLTTLRNKHVTINGATVHFAFKAKSGIQRAVDLHDPRLAKIIRHCQDLPGYDLFEYLNGDGTPHRITSQDVNDYLRQITGQDFTAKDFRTYAGTILAARALRLLKPASTKVQIKKNILQTVEAVAHLLGNTKAVCRRCYIHPALLEAYANGSLPESATDQDCVMAVLKKRAH